MTRTKKPTSPLRLLLVGSAASATLIAAAPAHAGPFDFIKRAVEKELRETLESATETAVQSALGGAVDATFKSEKGGMAQEADEGLRQEEHTTVGTADEIAAPAEERAGLLLPAVQPRIGTNGVNVAVGDFNGDGHADGKMSQNGTTVETAGEVQAPAAEQAALLLPAVQSVRASAPSARGKMSQNGTTVSTASEVRAPERNQGSNAIDPKTGDARGKRKPKPASPR